MYINLYIALNRDVLHPDSRARQLPFEHAETRDLFPRFPQIQYLHDESTNP